MNYTRFRLSALLIVGLPLCLAAQTSAAAPVTMDQFLTAAANLSNDDIADAHAGRAVARVLPTANSRDVTVFGIIALHLTREQYAARLVNLPAIAARGSARFGVISAQPLPADFAGVSVDKSEYRAFRDCHVGDCKFKLPAAAMRLFADSVDWNSPNAHGQLDSLVRSYLLRVATDYAAVGDDAMPHYDDTHGRWGRDAFDSLATQPWVFGDRAVELRDYLLSYPRKRPGNARELLYWSEERMPRLRPTFTLAHLVLYTAADGTPIVARKLVYANHYFESAVELTTIADGPFGADSPGIYVMTERHYRFDNLPVGLFNIRGRVRDKLTSLARSDLERERMP